MTALFINGNKIFAGFYRTGIYLSENEGESWEKIDSLCVWAKSFALCNNDIFVATGDGIFKSNDDGNSWKNTGCCLNRNTYDITCSGNFIFAAVLNKGLYYSSDGGSNWYFDESEELPSEVYALTIHNGYLFAGTDDGIWKRKISEFAK